MTDDERPGEFSYTRGIYPDMYRGRLWTMRQYAGFGSAEESNARYHYLISQGTTGLSVAFDLPTQMGLDADHPMAVGEVGRAGVAISSLADIERLFDGIPLERVSTSMTINSTAAILLAFYVLAARRQGADLPPVYSGHNAYGQWGPPPGTGPLLLVGYRTDGVAAQLFTGCRLIATVDNRLGVDNDEQGATVQLCDSPLGGSWAARWPQIRHLG